MAGRGRQITSPAEPMVRDLRCAAQLPAQDLARAKRWHSRMLGLDPLLERPDEIHYRCGGGTFFTVHTSGSAGTSEQTVLAWLTPDIDRDVAALKARGVVFESYDLPGLKTDERGVAGIGEDRVAWFKDSEGNVLAIGQSGVGLPTLLEEEP